MAVVRYLALVALVVWLGALQSVLLGRGADWSIAIAYGCGAVVVMCLFAMKFVGPPPRAFFIRLGIVVLMLFLTLFDRWLIPGPAAIYVNTALGLVLLAWYANE